MGKQRLPLPETASDAIASGEEERLAFLRAASFYLRLSSKTSPSETVAVVNHELGRIYDLIVAGEFEHAERQIEHAETLLSGEIKERFAAQIPPIISMARYPLLREFFFQSTLGNNATCSPYVMWREQLENAFPGTDCDAAGFRTTHRKDAVLTYDDYCRHQGRKGLLLSNSCGFAAGVASSDTIPSLLNAVQEESLFYNLSLCSTSIYQSRLALLLYAPPALDDIVIMEGATTLLYHLYFPEWDCPAPPIFGRIGMFEQRTKGAGQGLAKFDNDFRGAEQLPPDRLGERYTHLLRTFERALDGIAVTAEMRGARRLVFVLEPLLGWSAKPRSPWEAFLEKISLRYNHYLFEATVASPMRALYGRLTAELAEMCARRGIGYLDANQLPVMAENCDLFPDPYHVNGRCNEAITEALLKVLDIES